MATGNLPPFEDREAYGGFFPALLQTWVGACFRPTEFFESVGNSQVLTPALPVSYTHLTLPTNREV